MNGPYTITVTPVLLPEGEHKGHLEYLQFAATDGSNIHKWWTVNTGTLVDDFRALFGEWGPGLVERLRNGETVKLPRPIQLEALRSIGGSGNE